MPASVLRRRLLPALATVLSAATLVACGSGAEPPAPVPAGAAPAFSYTDSRGEVVELPSRPRRIVADEASASALIPLGIRPVGMWTSSPPDQSPALAGLDVSGIASAGEVFGEVDVERVAALHPDLVITGYYPAEKQFAGINPDDTRTVENLRRLAPIATIDATQPASEYIAAFADLAGRLGADLDGPAVAGARTAFENAVSDFTAAVAARPGLTATAVSPADTLYIANPPDFAEFRDLTAWGLHMQVPADTPPRGYFGSVSWENVGSAVTGTLVLLDARPGQPTDQDLVGQQPTWSLVPAVRAGAVTPWITDTFTNYATYTRYLQGFTTAIEKIDPASLG